MRTSTALAPLSALISLASAVDTSAYLWIVDKQTSKYGSNQVETASSDTLSAIVARRRGLSDSAYLSSTDESTLADINQFGGYQQPLFASGSESLPSKLFIRISGFDGSVSEFNSLPDLWIEKPTTDLWDNYGARTKSEDICEYDLTVPMKDNIKIVYSYIPEESSCMPKQEVEMLPTMLALYSSVPTSQTLAGKGMTSFSRMLRHFAATSNIESTVLILPSIKKLAKAPKLPSMKRSSAQKRKEEPLDLPPQTLSKGSSETGTTFANKSHPLPSTIPQCFSSKDSCTNTTNSCSGHGLCYLAHNNCYKCRCGRTLVRTNSDGSNKTVQWGGNACQKKDISMPFTLFASIGVAFTALVAGGIGMLYTMGSQELPSVIGAGVVGPRAQK